MAERRGPPLSRPVAMTVDLGICIACGACDDLVPGMRERAPSGRARNGRGPRIAITPATLEAMAECPVGAIRWLEGDNHEQDPGRP